MSQTLQNQILLAKSMNSIISFNDGAGSVIENGQITTNGLSTNTFNVNGIATLGALHLPNNDIIPGPDGNNYTLYCEGSSDLNSLNIVNKNAISQVKTVSSTTALTFSDPEYILINNTSSFTITLPQVTSSNVGSKFAFMLLSITSPTSIITINTYSGQNYLSLPYSYIDNTAVMNYNISLGSQANLTYYEYICVSVSSPQWIVTNNNNSYYLNAMNTWYSANTFNTLTTFLNGITVTGTSSIEGYLTTALAASTYVNLTSTQTISGAKSFTSSITIPTSAATAYLLPYGRETGSYRIGQNSLQNAGSGAVTNYAIGDGALQMATTLGTSYRNYCSNNISIGKNAGWKLTSDIAGTWSSDNNIMIGHNTGLTTFFNSIRNVVIGNNAGRNNILQDTVVIGDSALGSGALQIIQSVIIGSQCCKNQSDKSLLTVVGYNNAGVMSANGISIFGANNAQSSINNNSACIFGYNSMNNVNSNAGSSSFGANCGNSLTTGGYCLFLGSNSNTTLATAWNSIALGYQSLIIADFEMVLGGLCDNGSGKIGYPKICIPTKNYIYCNQIIATNTTLAFRSAENVLVTVNTVTAISLPTPSGNAYDNAGAKFNIMKTFTGTNTLTISAGVSQTIMWQGTAAATFVMDTTVSFATFVCISATTTGTTWEVTSTDKLNLKSPLSINSISGFTRILSDGADNLITGLTNATTIGIGNSSISLLGTTNTNNTVAVGSNSLTNATISQQNTSIGAFSMAGFNSTTNTTHANSALGAYSGQNLSNGINNTFLGSYTGFTSATQYNNSTAIGYSSTLTASNQIMLGTASETVVVPSTNIQYGSNYYPNKTFFSITSNTDWNASPPSGGFCKYVSFSATGISVINLVLPAISGLFEGFELIFRRTAYAGAGSSLTSSLTVSTTGSDLIFDRNQFTTNITATIIASGEYYGKVVLLSKSNFQWCYFPN